LQEYCKSKFQKFLIFEICSRIKPFFIDLFCKCHIHPVSVSRKRKLISPGQPSVYDITKSYPEERKRLEAEMKTKVEGLLAEDR